LLEKLICSRGRHCGGARHLLGCRMDRTSVDIFGNAGEVYMAIGRALAPDDRDLKLTVTGGGATINALQVFELRCAWK
jgi:hypothetical protein